MPPPSNLATACKLPTQHTGAAERPEERACSLFYSSSKERKRAHHVACLLTAAPPRPYADLLTMCGRTWVKMNKNAITVQGTSQRRRSVKHAASSRRTYRALALQCGHCTVLTLAVLMTRCGTYYRRCGVSIRSRCPRRSDWPLFGRQPTWRRWCTSDCNVAGVSRWVGLAVVASCWNYRCWRASPCESAAG